MNLCSYTMKRREGHEQQQIHLTMKHTQVKDKTRTEFAISIPLQLVWSGPLEVRRQARICKYGYLKVLMLLSLQDSRPLTNIATSLFFFIKCLAIAEMSHAPVSKTCILLRIVLEIKWGSSSAVYFRTSSLVTFHWFKTRHSYENKDVTWYPPRSYLLWRRP